MRLLDSDTKGKDSFFTSTESNPATVKRSHHSMCTKVASQSRVVIGGTDYQFVSYLFGGFVHNKYNQLKTSNDLIVVKYHRIMYDNSSQPKNGVAHYDGNEEAVYKTVTAKGRLPLPRRDHSACLIKDGQYLVVYGGKNDNAGEI